MSLHFYTRPNCPLCDRLERMVAAPLADAGIVYVKRQVDDDDAWRRRYGDRIPVLTADDDVVLEGRPTPEAVARALTRLTGAPGTPG